jgi:hypothetical protein
MSTFLCVDFFSVSSSSSVWCVLARVGVGAHSPSISGPMTCDILFLGFLWFFVFFLVFVLFLGISLGLLPYRGCRYSWSRLLLLSFVFCLFSCLCRASSSVCVIPRHSWLRVMILLFRGTASVCLFHFCSFVVL